MPKKTFSRRNLIKLCRNPRVATLIFTGLFIVTISLVFFGASLTRPYMGVTISQKNGEWLVTEVDSNGLAYQNGIRIGDKPLEINGLPAGEFLSTYSDDNIVYGLPIRTITVLSKSGDMISADISLAHISLASQIDPLIWSLVSIIFWVIGFFVFFSRPDNQASRLLLLCSLAFGLALSANVAGERLISTAIYFAVFASTLGPWLLLHFFLVLPEERRTLRRNRLIYLIYLPAVITMVLFPLIGYEHGQPVPWFRNFRLFEIGLGFLAVASIAIYNYYGTRSIRTRQQMKTFLFFSHIALIPFLLFSVLPELIWGQTVIPPRFGILLVAFIPLGMGYAVVTQKVLDIDIVIRRSVIYGLITLVMTALVSLAIVPAMLFHENLTILQQVFLALAIGALSGALFGPARRGIENLVDRFFYKDRYDYRQIVHGFSTSLNVLKDLNDVCRLTVGTLFQTLNLAGCCLLVRTRSDFFDIGAATGTFTNPQKQQKMIVRAMQLQEQTLFPASASDIDPEISFIVPLVAGDKVAGILFLSQKVSRQNFSMDDIFLIQGVASVAAVALRNALLVRDVSLRDTFISVASHELRTPLTSVIGYTELLIERDPPPDMRKRWLEMVLENARKIAELVDDLLNVARIQSGKITMKIEDIDLAALLEQKVSFYRESSRRHHIQLKIEPELPPARVDQDKFGLVIGNLLSNAIKYSPNGGTITVSASRDRERNRIIVSVSDQGIGISSEDQAYLFTTFHRILRPETSNIRGSGLGLYIVKEWTESMGGEVWLESELNRGSTFYVAVPASSSWNQVQIKTGNVEKLPEIPR